MGKKSLAMKKNLQSVLCKFFNKCVIYQVSKGVTLGSEKNEQIYLMAPRLLLE